jgi:hypothetical protein
LPREDSSLPAAPHWRPSPGPVAGQSCPAIDFVPPCLPCFIESSASYSLPGSKAIQFYPHAVEAAEADNPAVQQSVIRCCNTACAQTGRFRLSTSDPQGAGNRPGRPHMASFAKSAITLASRYHIPPGIDTSWDLPSSRRYDRPC